MAGVLPYGIYDADNHFNEPFDLYERYIDPALRDKAIRFATDADGTGRDKAAMLQLVGQRPPGFLSSGSTTARAVDNAVVLTGEETAGAAERRLFTHVYVRERSGEWKLLSSTTVAR